MFFKIFLKKFDCPASMSKNGNAKGRATANMVDTAIRKIMSDFQVKRDTMNQNYFK